MNENNYVSYNEEIEINLLDMIFYLLKHWRSLIAAIVIGTVIGGGIYAVKKVTAPEPVIVSEQNTEPEEDILKEYQVDPDVKSNMELAYQYRQLYKKQLEYNQKSVIMQLDPNAVYVGELKYYISAGYNTGLVSVLYQNILSDKGLLQELQEASDLDCDASYIKELISCAVNKENDSSISINNVEEDRDVVKNSFVVYTVVSTSEESCEKMLQVIKEKVALLDQECQDGYDGYSSLEVNDAVRLVTNNDYLNKQKANIDQLNTYLANVQRLEATFAADEQALTYYNKVYLSRSYVTSEEKEEPAEIAPEIVAEPESINPIKWLVIGIALGVLCWGGYYTFEYLLNGQIKNIKEVKSHYRLPVVGCLLNDVENLKGIDDFLKKQYVKYKGKMDTIEYLSASIESLPQSPILLCGNSECADIVNVLKNLHQTTGIETGNLVSMDVNVLNRAKQVEGVLLVCQTGVTSYEEIQRELDICRLQNIVVIGLVGIETI